MSRSTPAALARSQTRWVTQSGFHRRECAGSLEKRKAEGARVTPTAASAVVVSSRVSWMRAHVNWVDGDVPLLVRLGVFPELLADFDKIVERDMYQAVAEVD